MIVEASKAKEFIFEDEERETFFISKSLDKILEKSDNKLYHVYAVLDTQVGEKLFQMDWSYGGEPIIMRVFLHKGYLLKYYDYYKIVEL